MLESLNTELNEKNSALETRVLQLERQVIFANANQFAVRHRQCAAVLYNRFAALCSERTSNKRCSKQFKPVKAGVIVLSLTPALTFNVFACNLTRPGGHKVSILLGDREQHMLTILNGFKATNEQVGYQKLRCLLVLPLS